MVYTNPDRVFILGAGAQKAGTTWLHQYLRQHKGFRGGPLKEYHVWDAVYLQGPYEMTTEFPKQTLRQTLRNHARAALGLPVPVLLRHRMCHSPDAYFNYFQSLLQKPGTTHTGDFTPGYGALPKGAYENIRDSFAQRGIPVRVVFLMRDPVERIWSAVRMIKRNQKARIFDLSLSDDEALQQYVATQHAKYRGNYHKTLENLQAVFDPQDIHVGIYETMFGAGEITRLSRFLGVEARPDFADVHVNVSAKKTGLQPETVAMIQREFAPVYDYCARHYPETLDLWAYP